MFFPDKYDHNVTYVDYPSLAELKKELSREKTFIEHMDKYPESRDVLRIAPRLRKFCKERTYLCLEFLRYLNNHSSKARLIYNSPCPAKRLIEFFLLSSRDKQ